MGNVCDHIIMFGYLNLFDYEDGQRSIIRNSDFAEMIDRFGEEWCKKNMIERCFNYCPICGEELTQ